MPAQLMQRTCIKTLLRAFVDVLPELWPRIGKSQPGAGRGQGDMSSDTIRATPLPPCAR